MNWRIFKINKNNFKLKIKINFFKWKKIKIINLKNGNNNMKFWKMINKFNNKKQMNYNKNQKFQ